jgi:uncharacterized protein YcaQ
MYITKAQARRFLLVHQGLWQGREFQDKDGILAFIRHVGCIQYDPLDIVGKNPELVLQARVKDFRPDMLRELLYEDRQLLDGFDKAMSIYPVEDWPYFRRRREAYKNGSGKAEPIMSVLAQVRAAVEERGPLSSLDLEMNEKIAWDWSESRLARAALESMYFSGELVIHHKAHTRKFYDLVHRCLPEELLYMPDPNQTDAQYQDWYVTRRIGSVGLLWDRAGEAWLGMHKIKSKERRPVLKRLVEKGRIEQVQVEGIQEPFYLRDQDRPTLERASEMDEQPSQARFIAPLDNLCWDRRMLKELFDFDYRWEVYVPVNRRNYGYYVLPVLYGDRFIARFDPAFDKKNGVLTVKNWWWEPEIVPSEQMAGALAQSFQGFLGYLDARRLELGGDARENPGLEWMGAI